PERKDEGVDQRLDERRVLYDLLEIREADKSPGRIVDGVSAYRIIDREQKRQSDQQQDIDQRGRHQDGLEHLTSIEQEVKAGDRLCNGFSDDGHGHVLYWGVARLPLLSKC